MDPVADGATCTAEADESGGFMACVAGEAAGTSATVAGTAGRQGLGFLDGGQWLAYQCLQARAVYRVGQRLVQRRVGAVNNPNNVVYFHSRTALGASRAVICPGTCRRLG